MLKQYCIDGKHRFGKVYFYFRCRSQGQEMTLAVVSMYSEPNPILLAASHGTFVSCQYLGDNALAVIEVSCIESVIAMVPHYPPHSKDSDLHFFLIERPGLDIVNLGSAEESISD